MPNAKEPIRAPAQQRTRTDLTQQYRPIGIGAVAAALTVKGKQESDAEQATDAQSEQDREIESLAA
jgi:anthranilate phosphoribosyltransferase